MLLTDLDTDLLLAVCFLLDPCSLAGLACVSRRFNSIIKAPELWEPCCRSRWRHLRAELYQHPPPADVDGISPSAPHGVTLTASAQQTHWKALYDEANGWQNPNFNLRHLPINADCDFVSAIACAAQSDLLHVATSHRIEAWVAGEVQHAVAMVFNNACSIKLSYVRTMPIWAS